MVALVTLTLLSGTVVLVVIADGLVRRAEDALLEQRGREAAMVVQSVADGFVIPLRTAVMASTADDGGAVFPASMSVMLRPVGSYDRAVLLERDGTVLAEAGDPVQDLEGPERQAILRAALDRSDVTPTSRRAAGGLMSDGGRRALAVAVAGPPGASSHVGYAEVPLTQAGPVRPAGEAFQDVDFALYFGVEERADAVVLRSTDDLPLGPDSARVPVWLGGDPMTLVLTSHQALVGGVTAKLPWIAALAGLCVTAAAAVLVDGVLRRRDAAVRRSGELSREVEARTTQLSSANRELEAFAFSVSHDLRAPLRAIDGFTLAVLDDHADVLPEEGRSHLLRVRRAARRMGLLIDDLLMLSRVTRQPMRVEDVDLSAEARTSLRRLQESEPDRVVEVDVADDLRTRGDPGLLRLALDNLLANAWKYTRDQPTARIEVGADVVEGRPVYWVRDNGVGFDPTYSAKLFQPFQRLHDPAEFEGTGIGLATVARVVERHRGDVWADAQPGRGATFSFTCDVEEPLS